MRNNAPIVWILGACCLMTLVIGVQLYTDSEPVTDDTSPVQNTGIQPRDDVEPRPQSTTYTSSWRSGVTAPVPHSLQVTRFSWRFVGTGWARHREAVGYIRNVSNSTISMVEMNIAMFGKDGVRQEKWSPSVTDLRPGSIARFSARPSSDVVRVAELFKIEVIR